LEKVVKWLYAHDSSLRLPYQDNLAALIHEPTFQRLVAPSLFNQIRLIHKIGNQAVHTDMRLKQIEGVQLTRAVHHLMSWMVRVYTRTGGVPVQVPPFDDRLLLEPLNQAREADKTAAELSRLQEALRGRDEAFAAAQTELAASQEEIDRLQAEIRRIRAENEAALGQITFEESEAETRDLFIDVLLREAGSQSKKRLMRSETPVLHAASTQTMPWSGDFPSCWCLISVSPSPMVDSARCSLPCRRSIYWISVRTRTSSSVLVRRGRSWTIWRWVMSWWPPKLWSMISTITSVRCACHDFAGYRPGSRVSNVWQASLLPSMSTLDQSPAAMKMWSMLSGGNGVSADELHGFGRLILQNSESIRARAISPCRRRCIAR
jgi:hypothetical protein